MGSVSVDSEQDDLFSNLEDEFLAAEDNERENENDTNNVDNDLDSLFGDAADDDLHSLFSESEDDEPQRQKQNGQQPEPPSQLQHHASNHTPPEPGPVELTLPQPSSSSTTTGSQPSQQSQPDHLQQQQPLPSQDLSTSSLPDFTPDELELLALTCSFTDDHDESVGQQEGQCMPSAPDPPASPFSLQDGHTSGGPAVSTQTHSDSPPEPSLSMESLDWLEGMTFDEADIEAAIAQMEKPENLLNGMVDQVSDPWQGEGAQQQQPQQQSISQKSFESSAEAGVPLSSPPQDNSLPQVQEPYAGQSMGNVSPQANDPNLLTPPASSPENTPPAPADNQYIRVSDIPGFRYGHCYTNRGATITRRVDLHPNQLPILLDYITLGKCCLR